MTRLHDSGSGPSAGRKERLAGVSGLTKVEAANRIAATFAGIESARRDQQNRHVLAYLAAPAGIAIEAMPLND